MLLFVLELVRRLTNVLTALLSHLFAWKMDRHRDPDNVSAKRRELMETVPRGARVLEIGAGTGGTLLSGAYEGSAGRLSHLTLSEPDTGMRARLVAKLAGRATGVTAGDVAVVEASLPSLPFDDGTFDAVVLIFVHSHVADRAAAAREVARVLKTGGRLLFMDHGAHLHGHGHGHGHGYRHGHDRGHEPKKARPWVFEWLRFMKHEHTSTDELCLDRVLKELRQEALLEETFQNRMEVDFFTKEVTYGIFTRK